MGRGDEVLGGIFKVVLNRECFYEGRKKVKVKLKEVGEEEEEIKSEAVEDFSYQ